MPERRVFIPIDIEMIAKRNPTRFLSALLRTFVKMGGCTGELLAHWQGIQRQVHSSSWGKCKDGCEHAILPSHLAILRRIHRSNQLARLRKLAKNRAGIGQSDAYNTHTNDSMFEAEIVGHSMPARIVDLGALEFCSGKEYFACANSAPNTGKTAVWL